MRKLCFILILTLFYVVSILAQTSENELQFKNSIQTNPIGFISGKYGANFEHRFTSKHAALIEVALTDTDNMEGYSASLYYRYYKEPYKDAKFLFIKSNTGIPFRGIFIRKMDIDGIMEVKEDDVSTKYDYSYNAFHIGANFGRTYLWDSGFIMSYRIGYGFPIAEFKWTGVEPEEGDLMKGIYSFFSGFDFGLTVGYCF